MLKTLKRIIQDVSHAASLEQALQILVQRVQEAINCDAVNAYLIDYKHNEYVLVATEGLPLDKSCPIHFHQEQGIVGLIGRREEPINTEDAHLHPNFIDHPMLNESQLHGFLGVPILQHRKLYGVLTVQQEEKACFDDEEEAFLITLAAQLGGLIAHAEATGELLNLTTLYSHQESMATAGSEMSLSGLGCVAGISIGRGVVIYPQADIDAVPKQLAQDPEKEIQAFLKALNDTKDYIQRLGRRIAISVGQQEQALFDVYVGILGQDQLRDEIVLEIQEEHLTAEAALSTVIKRYISQFNEIADPYLRERATDIKDIGQRILAELQAIHQEESIYNPRTILVGEEITAADLAEVPEGYLAGIVSIKGSNNSHVAILARAMNIPTVMGVIGLKLEDLSKRAIIVDGYSGTVIISPPKNLIYEYKQLCQEEDELNESLFTLRDKLAETQDNYRLKLQVNTGLAMDAGLSMSVGAEGVGLYRSEVPFMSRDRFPSEDEQYIIYRQILKAFAPHEVTMRTLDIGGDKILPYFPIKESNPYLGWRGIRVTLDHPDVFLLQVRAMMRANEETQNLRIMLPMVTTLSEVDEAIYLIHQAYQELLEEGYNIPKPQIGVMIEVPAAAYQAHEFAKRVDFLSVGSNDLTQYFLAVDRNNAHVANLYDSLHPAILKMLMKIVESGHAAGVKVSICGEMAGDPLATLLLLAMGFDALSMNSASLLRIKWVIRNFSLAQSRQVLADVLAMENPNEIRLYLQEILQNQGLGGLIRAGKH
ncbi:MAG: phosphoenolpyruvate-protein phosphotransferase PtsP [Gammaproteobacteria bacterium]|nr:phosphoenolpyruvate-protein phosphotransferase PtsP [Gammaproteobacteria bacterium]